MVGLYIHIPFCKSRCSYCSFTIAGWNETIENQYINRLIVEFEQYKDLEIDTIYFGGGTPSTLSVFGIEKIINAINRIFKNKATEITFECNPDDVTHEYVKVLKANGVNRISLGVQTFSNEILKNINRTHNSVTAMRAIEILKTNFKNFSVDLILGLPGINSNILNNDIEKILKLSVPHISIYGLSVEQNTKIYNDVQNKSLQLLDDDVIAQYYQTVHEKLKINRIYRYEISNFSHKGYESKHNLKYWTMQEYIGTGIAAHSFYKNERFHNTSSLNQYLAKDNVSIKTVDNVIGLKDYAYEYLILGLRLDKGINVLDFKQKTGMDFFTEYKNFYKKYKDCFHFENNRLRVKNEFTYAINSLLSEL